MSNTHNHLQTKILTQAGVDHPETFCAFPFFQIALKDWGDGVISSIAPCCNALSSGPNPLNLDMDGIRKDFNIDNIFNGPEFTDLRNSLLQGKRHSACVNCWKLESEGTYSPRAPALDFFQDCTTLSPVEGVREIIATPTLTSIDTNFDNNCNLMCRMCSPLNSRKLGVEFRDLKFRTGVTPPLNLSPDWNHTDLPESVYLAGENIDMPAHSLEELKTLSHQLAGIKIAGGEPTISDNFWSWMDYIEEHGLKKNITMHLTTNGTKFNKRFIDAIRGFKKVELIVSVDGFGKMYEYIRFPFRWDSFKKNVERLYLADLPNTKLALVYISTNISMSSVAPLLEWASTMPKIHLDVNLFVRPADGPLSPRWLPKHLIRRYLAEIENAMAGKDINTTMKTMESLANLRTYMIQPDYPENLMKLKRNLMVVDAQRKQSYVDFLDPELVEVLSHIEITEEYYRKGGEEFV